MSDLNKELSVSESDPASLEERTKDSPGSFLDIYRSLSIQHVHLDQDFVDKAVALGVVPSSIRYGRMERGDMEVFRGVVKSYDGSFHYFNWARGADFKLVPADNNEKVREAERLFRGCEFGCDLNKSTPVDPGESIEEEEDAEKAVPGTGVSPVQEDQWILEQQSMQTEVHPGSTHSQTPDDPTVGRDWHGTAVAKASDAMPELASNDGVQHWDRLSIVKALAGRMQETAPRVAPKFDPVEAQYMREVLNASESDIQKGFRLAPRHRVSFEQWKSSRLRTHITGLQKWLEQK